MQYCSNPSLNKIIDAILSASIEIESFIRKSASHHKGVLADSINFSGDEQKPLDVLSNDVMIERLQATQLCSYLLSEENEEAICCFSNNESKEEGYMVAFDPLDGSSNIDCNVCIGTIFSIYKKELAMPTLEKDDKMLEKVATLRPGTNLLAAGYVLYGPATDAVLAFDFEANHKVCQQYTLNPDTKQFEFVQSLDISNKKKKIYSINEGNSNQWFPNIANYVNQFKDDGGYTQRYIGSMVADVHRTLMYGGMFCYPADKKNPKGKLRLIYECFPMAFILEAAGGGAIDCSTGVRILSKVPSNIHERTPILLGSTKEVDKFIL